MGDCTTCMYEYVCDWAEAGHCDHYRPDLEEELGNNYKQCRNIQRISGE